MLAAIACMLACAGGSGPGPGGIDGPGTPDPSPGDPPPDNVGGGVTIEGTGRSFATIQAALDVASHGDVLELAPGIYRESLSFTHAVTLRGRDGPATTILDGEQSRRILFIDSSSAGRTVRLEGLTLRDGNADPGGAIRFAATDLECVNCVFLRCRFESNRGNQGGAVLASAGAGASSVEARFQQCIFQLRFDSPALDAGEAALLPEALIVDLAGAPRVQGEGPDPGAFERE